MTSFRTLLATSLLTLLPFPVIAGNDYPPQVRSIVEQRCMVCHGCYDAPCQLKLDAWAGLERGASKQIVYDGTRLVAAKPTRLFDDADTIEQWRQMGFYPVLDEETPEKSVVTRMLELKQQHPLPDSGTLPDTITLGLDRKQQCPKPGAFDQFARDYPTWGMPYGLPGLNEAEHKTMTDWLSRGAPGAPRAAPPALQADEVKRWETFFNGKSLKERLMARYIYEHLFIGNLYFPDLGNGDDYFTLVRSRTPPGKPIEVIATRRPYDDPGVDTFYYRLQPLRTAVLVKRHMPYALNDARMERWRALFLETEYEVTELPSYTSVAAANPFVTFRELPEDSRYKFMLDEAHFTIMGFIKGPVCRGQVALNVINDHFWVVFLHPDRETDLEGEEFLARASANLRLPGDRPFGTLVTLVDWNSYSRAQLRFLKEKFEHIQRVTGPDGIKLDLDFIWDGDGHNKNASLTIFRHTDSATVVKGLVGQHPKTAWVIDYSLLERIHYLLVAGFDVFGNVSHQLETRLYMDFLRMEGEQNFLFFLPPEDRLVLRNFWYRNATREAERFVMTESVAVDRTTDIEYKTSDPKREFLNMLRQRLPGATPQRFRLDTTEFDRLQVLQGTPFSYLPEVAYVEVLRDNAENSVYSIIHNNGFLNNAQIFHETVRRVPQEDYVTVVRGFIGAYPNIFFQVPEQKLPDFTESISALRSADDYAELVSKYGVRRTDPRFWPVSDRMHNYYREWEPREAGLLDLNRYENR